MALQAGRPALDRDALEHALKVWLIVIVAAGGAWLGSLLVVDSVGPLSATVGGLAALVASLAAGVVAYHLRYERGVRERLARLGDDRLERRLRELLDGPLPELVDRLRAGASPRETLAGLPATRDHLLGRLVHLVAEAVAAGTREAAEAKAELHALDREVVALAEETLPALVKRIHEDRVSASTALAEIPAPAHNGLNTVLDEVANALVASDRTRAAAMAAAASAAARIQAQTTRMLGQLRELEDRYNEDEVFGDLLDLDHRVSQMGRLADSIALLSGGRSGRRWTKPIVMESIIRGAMGRIASYNRVQYHSTTTAAVAGFAAEGVMHALAELMDNAANFSPHGTAVHVYAEEEDAGVVVTIEDAGLGMRQRERERAERLVSEAADLTSLPGTRLGLAVVGRLAGKHDLSVSFRPSSRGGIGVVVLIPRRLLTHVADGPGADAPSGPGAAGSALAARGTRTRAALATATRAGTAGTGAADPGAPGGDPAAGGHGEGEGQDADELHLPKRRRGATLSAAGLDRPATRTVSKPRDPGAQFSAFRRAASGRHRAPGGPPPTGPSSGPGAAADPRDGGDGASTAEPDR